MKNFFISYGRFFLLAFVLGFLIPRFNGTSLLASSPSFDDYYQTYHDIETLDTMIVTFHKSMNDMTNQKITALWASTDPNVLYPSADSSCGTDNLSTYCLAYDLNNNLLGFEKALMERKDDLQELKRTVGSDDSDPLNSLDDAVQFANQQALVVEEQMNSAEATLDLTLAVYNQIEIVWPLHQELETFRKNLEDFRDGLAKVRDVVEAYPGKFNGASTAQCK